MKEIKLFIKKCPECNLPCMASHKHYINEKSEIDRELQFCGCVKGHMWEGEK